MRPNRPGIAEGDSAAPPAVTPEAHPPVRGARSERSLKEDLARLVKAQVDARIEALGKNLIQNVVAQGQKAIEGDVAEANRQINKRIEKLERNASEQLRHLSSLTEASRSTAAEVERAVNAVDRALYATPARSRPRTAVQTTRLCKNCSSADVHPSHRDSLADEFRRLFFINPYRCHRCLRRFYRFF